MVYEFSVREKKIINILSLNRDDFVSGKQLSTITGVTERTIRNDIKNINNYLASIEAHDYFHIDSIHAKGYKLAIENEARYREFFNDLHGDIEVAEREKTKFEIRLVRLLILLNRNMTLYKISNLIGYSEQITADIIRRNNQMYRIKMSYYFETKNGKISVVGEEKNLRIRILNTIFVNPKFKGYPQRVRTMLVDEEFDKNVLEVLKECFSGLKNYSICNMAFLYMAKWLFISRRRESFGCKIEFTDAEKKLVMSFKNEYALADNILKTLADRHGYKFDNDDIYFVTAMIAAFGDIKENGYEMLPEEVKPLCDFVCYQMQKDFKLDNVTIYNIKQNLSYYFRAFNIRQTFELNRQYIGITRIKRRLITATEYARILAKELKKVFSIKITDKEMVFLSVCIAEIIDKCRLVFKQNVLIVSKYGYFEAKRYVENLYSDYSKYINSIDIAESYEEGPKFQGYDLILTDDVDLAKKSDRYMRYWAYSTTHLLPKKIDQVLTGINDNSYFLSKITNACFEKGLDFNDKRELFKYIAKMYCQDKGCIKEMVLSLEDEEAQMTFECGHNAALITFIQEGYDQSIRFFVLEKPIAWDIRLVSLVIVITGSSYAKLQEYEIGLTHLMYDTMNIDRLVSDPSVATVKSILNKAEN